MKTRAGFVGLALALVALAAPASQIAPVGAAGGLDVVIWASPYALVDSNKPGVEGPMVFTFRATITNTSGAPRSNIDIYVGDGTTPGTFPLGSDGTTRLALLGGVADAARFKPSLAPGESDSFMWQMKYPALYNKTYSFTVWAESEGGLYDGSDSRQITTRSSITAAANKQLGTITVAPPGGTVNIGNYVDVRVSGFNLGQIGEGPNGEQDAWMQPVGNLSFDPTCFRLMHTEISIASIDPPYAMPYEDRLYFSGIGSLNPAPNYSSNPGDYILYRFMSLAECSTTLQPYQEVASGQEEKYSGDYASSGTTISVSAHGSAIDLDKSVSPSSAGVGDTLTWTIGYTNISSLPVGDPGGGAALVIIDEAIPAGTVYVPLSADGSDDCIIFYSDDDGATWSTTEPADPADVTTIKWYINETIPAFGTGSVWFDSEVTSVDGPICNTATAQIGDSTIIAASTECANVPPDVEATKVDALLTDLESNGQVNPGDVVRYTVVITAEGDADAESVVYNDTPDPNVTLNSGSVATSQGTVTLGNTLGDTSVRVDIGDISPGSSVTVTYDVTVNDPLPEGCTHITNQGIVRGANFPSEATDDPDTAPEDDPTVVQVTSTPNLVMTKTVSLSVDADSDGFPSPGDTLAYTVIVTNTGNEDATGVLVTDPSPDYTSLVVGSVTTTQGSVLQGNTAGDALVKVEIGTLSGGGGSATVQFLVAIDDVIPVGVTTISNQAFVEGSNSSTVPSDDPGTPPAGDPTETHVTAAPDLEVYKHACHCNDADGDGFPSPGDNLTYTITILNDGNQEARDIVFADTPDPNTTLVVPTVSTSQGTVITGNSPGDVDILVNVGTLTPGEQVEISFTVLIDEGEFSQVSNQSTATGGNFDDEPSDDPETPADDDPTVTAVSTNGGEPLIEAYKTDVVVVDADGSGGLSIGDTVEYVVTITNSGTGPASGATFTDTPDANTSLVAGSVSTSLGSVTTGNGGGDTSVEVSIGTINIGVTVTIGFRVVLESGSYSEISNQGLVAWGTLANDDEPTDDPDTSATNDPTVSTLSAPLLSATKSDSLADDADASGNVSQSDTLTYTILISNSGTGAAIDVVLTDTPDANTSLVVGSVTTTLGTVAQGNDAGDSVVEVDIPLIGPGVTVTVEFDVLLKEGDYTSVSNQGLVDGGGDGTLTTDDPGTTDVDDPTDTLVYAGESPTPPITPRAVGGEALAPDKVSIVSGLLLSIGVLAGSAIGLRRLFAAR